MAKRGKTSIMFICTGNTCRSPMAAGYTEKLLKERGIKHIEVKTAGVMTVSGLLPTQETVLLLEEVGVDIQKHRSTPLTPDMIKKTDYILGFTPFHVQSAIRMSEDARGKTFLLKEFVGGDPRRARIQDPMGCTLEVYRRVFNEIMKACEKLLDKPEIRGETKALKKKAAAKKKPKKKGAAKKAAPKKKTAKKAATKKTKTKPKKKKTTTKTAKAKKATAKRKKKK